MCSLTDKEERLLHVITWESPSNQNLSDFSGWVMGFICLPLGKGKQREATPLFEGARPLQCPRTVGCLSTSPTMSPSALKEGGICGIKRTKKGSGITPTPFSLELK